MNEIVNELIKNRFNRVLDIYETAKFIDIIGIIGGDVITLRVHNNGMVTER